MISCASIARPLYGPPSSTLLNYQCTLPHPLTKHGFSISPAQWSQSFLAVISSLLVVCVLLAHLGTEMDLFSYKAEEGDSTSGPPLIRFKTILRRLEGRVETLQNEPNATVTILRFELALCVSSVLTRDRRSRSSRASDAEGNRVVCVLWRGTFALEYVLRKRARQYPYKSSRKVNIGTVPRCPNV